MLTAFIVVGLIFIFYEWWLKKSNKNMDQEIQDLTWQQSIIIGLGQALAVLPGVSRSGAVIMTMMLLGQKRSEAAKYSFLLALPTLCGAATLDFLKMETGMGMTGSEATLLAIGFITSFLTALVVLNWFIKYLQKHTLSSFGVYRIILGLILIQLL
jgi:undecaprenyl-diphosphatase